MGYNHYRQFQFCLDTEYSNLGSAGRHKEFPWVKLHSPEYAGAQKLYRHFMQISHLQNTLRIHKIHVNGTEISCNTSQKSKQYYLHLVNLQAHVPTLYRSCGHSMPLIGMAVLNSNTLHVRVAPHQKQRKFTVALVVPPSLMQTSQEVLKKVHSLISCAYAPASTATKHSNPSFHIMPLLCAFEIAVSEY